MPRSVFAARRVPRSAAVRKCAQTSIVFCMGAMFLRTFNTAFAGGGVLALHRPTPGVSSQLSPRLTARKAGDALFALDSIEAPVSAYVNIWTPYFKAAQESGLAPEFLLHWGHAAAMGTVLIAMGGYGTFMGWQTRLGNGNVVYPLNLGMTAKEIHPLLMGAALFFFFLGGQGGLVLLATAGQPILQSAHSSTAVVGLGLMGAQAALGVTMGDESNKRTVHAFLGTGVMLVLLVHLYFGLNLGSSF